MEIEQLKSHWLFLSKASNEAKSIEVSEIKQISKGKFNKGLFKMFLIEIVGILTSAYFSILILYKFFSFDTLLLKLIALFTLLVLITIPVLRCTFLKRLFQSSNFTMPHFESVKIFMDNEIKFQKIQKACVLLGFILIVFLLVLNVKVYNEYDVTKSLNFWLISFALSILFAFVYWNFIVKYYNKKIKQALAIIEDLN